MGGLAALWLSLRQLATNAADAAAWLADNTNIAGSLTRALTGVLRDMWSKAFDMGVKAAEQLIGHAVPLPSDALSQLLNSYGPAWVRQIVANLMQKLADILAGGGPASRLEAAIQALLDNAQHAYMIALTEITRAAAMAASAVYSLAGIRMVNWVTAHDARVCAVCNSNQAASPHPLGQVFPGGAFAPPQHPNCRCALVPA